MKLADFMKSAILFIVCFALWLVLNGTVTRAVLSDTQTIAGGLVASLVVTLFMRNMTNDKLVRWINPLRYFWLIVYCVLMVVHFVRAALDTAYRVFHPAMPIAPEMVTVNTILRTPTAITFLANSITLATGTLTVDATAEGVLTVHCLNSVAADPAQVTQAIVGRFEWVLKRIFE